MNENLMFTPPFSNTSHAIHWTAAMLLLDQQLISSGSAVDLLWTAIVVHIAHHKQIPQLLNAKAACGAQHFAL